MVHQTKILLAFLQLPFPEQPSASDHLKVLWVFYPEDVLFQEFLLPL